MAANKMLRPLGWRQIVPMVGAALQLVLGLLLTVIHVVSEVLWLPALGVGVLLTVLVAVLWPYRRGRVALRTVLALLGIGVLAVVGLLVYAMLASNAFDEYQPSEWIQTTVCYVYTVYVCLLPAPMLAACGGGRGDVWTVRVLTLIGAAMTADLAVYEYRYVGLLLHSGGVIGQCALCALALLLCAGTWWLPFRRENRA